MICRNFTIHERLVLTTKVYLKVRKQYIFYSLFYVNLIFYLLYFRSLLTYICYIKKCLIFCLRRSLLLCKTLQNLLAKISEGNGGLMELSSSRWSNFWIFNVYFSLLSFKRKHFKFQEIQEYLEWVLLNLLLESMIMIISYYIPYDYHGYKIVKGWKLELLI